MIDFFIRRGECIWVYAIELNDYNLQILRCASPPLTHWVILTQNYFSPRMTRTAEVFSKTGLEKNWKLLFF